MAKKTVDNSAPKKPPLEKPSHGKGAIFRGGVPGNKGGTGRPPNAVRRILAADAMSARDKLVELLERKEPCEECGMALSVRETAFIFDKFAKYGIGTARSNIDPAMLHGLAEAVQAITGATEAQMRELFTAWRRIIGTHVAGDA